MERKETHKIALVTGASSGIGLAYARLLAAKGHRLILVSQDRARLDKVTSELSSAVMLQLPIDLSQRAGVKELIEFTPTPDVLIANAGVTLPGAVGAIDQSTRDSLYYLLCGGVIDLLESQLPRMSQREEGRVVVISSIAAITPMRKSAVYASAKAAVARYTDSLAVELRNSPLKLTVSLPGYVRTAAHERAGLGHLQKQIPEWMWLTADEVVQETERASLQGKTSIVPGRVYRWVRPFLGSPLANAAWQHLSSRRT